MALFLEVILPILGFLIAIFGAWDKLVTGIKYINKKQTERSLNIYRNKLHAIEFYNEEPLRLIAYEFKQLFLLIAIIFLVSILNVTPPKEFLGNEMMVVSSHSFSVLAGYFIGNALRVTNYVINHKKLKAEIESKLDKLEKKKANL